MHKIIKSSLSAIDKPYQIWLNKLSGVINGDPIWKEVSYETSHDIRSLAGGQVMPCQPDQLAGH